MTDRDLDSGSWLTYLTPVTAAVLAAALYAVVQAAPPSDARASFTRERSVAASNAERLTAALPQFTRPLGPPPPYVIVLVSSAEEIEEARQSIATAPDAYVDFRVSPPRGRDRATTLIIGEITSHRTSNGLPEPIVIDLRP